MAYIRTYQYLNLSGFDYGMWHILEPVMLVEINAPGEFQGSVMAGMTKRNAVILGTDANEGYFTLYCEVSKYKQGYSHYTSWNFQN